MENILQRINSSAVKLLLPLTLDNTYKTITKEGRDLVYGKYGSIFLSSRGKLFRVFASDNQLYGIAARNKGYVYTAYKTKKLQIVDIADVLVHHPEMNSEDVKTILFIPLTYANKTNGVLTLHSNKEAKVLNEKAEELNVFGSMASLAIRNAQLYEQLNKAVETRDLFISLASHELKTPLTALNGYTQLLKKSFQNSDSREKEWTNAMDREIKRLIKLLNELLEVNQIKTGDLQFNFVEVNVKDIVKAMVSNYKVMYPERSIKFIEDKPLKDPIIKADSDKIQQVITNILNNAIKFSDADKEVQISLGEDKKHYSVKVTDNGIGIPENEITNVFKGFYKGNHDKKEGMGLGLYLAREIINRHNGEIIINSREKKGTSVEIKFLKQK